MILPYSVRGVCVKQPLADRTVCTGPPVSCPHEWTPADFVPLGFVLWFASARPR